MSKRHRALPWSRWNPVRLRVLERDGWRCTECGKAGRLEVHHVLPLERGGEYLDPENCVTLCRSCHVALHRRPETAQARAWLAFRDELRATS